MQLWGDVPCNVLIIVYCSSPSISGAVIMKLIVAVYIQFISLLVVITPSQLLQSYASCLMPSFLECCCHCSTSLLMLGSSDSHSLCWVLLTSTVHLLFWVLAAHYIQWLLGMHVGIACLDLEYWDSLSDFAFACLDSMSGFPGLWLAVANWCLFKCIHCKLGCDWLLIIILQCDMVLTLLVLNMA